MVVQVVCSWTGRLQGPSRLSLPNWWCFRSDWSLLLPLTIRMSSSRKMCPKRWLHGYLIRPENCTMTRSSLNLTSKYLGPVGSVLPWNSHNRHFCGPLIWCSRLLLLLNSAYSFQVYPYTVIHVSVLHGCGSASLQLQPTCFSCMFTIRNALQESIQAVPLLSN